MRILVLHAKEFWYRTTRSTKFAEGPGGEKSLGECLVMFTSVEKGDGDKIREFLDMVDEYTERLGRKTIVLYPYAHLSEELEEPRKAVEILRDLEEKLREKGYSVHRAPFGWYKEFRIHVLGHPLAESFRRL